MNNESLKLLIPILALSIPVLGMGFYGLQRFWQIGRPDRGMPSAERLGLSPEHFDGAYEYLQGRSSGKYFGGGPGLREP